MSVLRGQAGEFLEDMRGLTEVNNMESMLSPEGCM